jgi:hypothetical protein
MIQWYREGRFPIDRIVKYYPVSAFKQPQTHDPTDKVLGGGLPESIFRYEGRHCDQTNFNLVDITTREMAYYARLVAKRFFMNIILSVP